ncbi:MAG TPA: hypothetical protein VD813_05845, partial [Pseudonocardia sp.]|nr:hypothetical protein [Pseudonocardia sp.]
MTTTRSGGRGAAGGLLNPYGVDQAPITRRGAGSRAAALLLSGAAGMTAFGGIAAADETTQDTQVQENVQSTTTSTVTGEGVVEETTNSVVESAPTSVEMPQVEVPEVPQVQVPEVPEIELSDSALAFLEQASQRLQTERAIPPHP